MKSIQKSRLVILLLVHYTKDYAADKKLANAVIDFFSEKTDS